MAQDVVAAPLGEVRIAGAASGVALTTTAAFTSLFRGTTLLRLVPRNAVTAVVVRYALNPWLTILKTTDALVAASNITDGSYVLQDNNTSTTLTMNSFDTAANNDYLYVGSHIPFRGVRIIVGNTNSTNSALTVKYWNGTAWTDASATDGTSATSKTLNQNGNVTWTLPSDWVTGSLQAIGDTTLFAPAELVDDEMYWTRWEVDTALDATVTITGAQSMSRVTTYDEFPVDLAQELRVKVGPRGISCVEALTDAGTANLLVRCAAMGIGAKFLD